MEKDISEYYCSSLQSDMSLYWSPFFCVEKDQSSAERFSIIILNLRDYPNIINSMHEKQGTRERMHVSN